MMINGLFVSGCALVDTDCKVGHVPEISPVLRFVSPSTFEKPKRKDERSESQVTLAAQVGFVVTNNDRNGNVMRLCAKARHSRLKQIAGMDVRCVSLLVQGSRDRHAVFCVDGSGTPKKIAALTSEQIITIYERFWRQKIGR